MTDRNPPYSGGSGELQGVAQRPVEPFFHFPPGSTNVTAITAAASKIPTTTEPTTSATAGRYVIDPGSDTEFWCHFLGGVADNAKGDWAVWGWRWRPDSRNAGSSLWVPRYLAGGSFILNSAAPGVVASPIDASWYYADQIIVNTDNTPPNRPLQAVDVIGAIGWLSLRMDGEHLIEVEITGNSDGTDCTKVNGEYWTR